MLRTLDVRRRDYPLATPFRISRGVKTLAETVTVAITADGVTGRGEGVPYPRYGESIDGARAEIAATGDAIRDGASRIDLRSLMRAGAARNAVDCALWDLEARLGETTAWAIAGLPSPAPLATAITIGLDTPEAMAIAAQKLRDVPLIKIKVDRNRPDDQIRAVRAIAPRPRTIVDPNESWTMDEVERLQPLLAELAIDLLEQPLPAGADDSLRGFTPLVPIAADESAHVSDDVAALADRYQVINIKLDKTGGLTEALRLADAAAAAGLGLMTGSMICSSLSIAPALLVAARCSFADLDGPFWLADDHADGVRNMNGTMLPPLPGFWGSR